MAYQLHFLWMSGYFKHRCVKHVNQASISSRTLATSPLILPPIPEQYRIVAEIDKQFTRLDVGVATLQRVQANLKRYRAAILKAACEGRLVPTEAELARHEGRCLESADKLLSAKEQLSHSKQMRRRAGRLWGSGYIPELTPDEKEKLPEGWVWTKVRSLGYDPEDAVQVGPMSMKSEDFIESGVPVLNVGCVQWAHFDESKLNFLPEDKAREFTRYRIQPGDILFTRSGTVGRCAVAQLHHCNWLMTFHLLRVRLDPSCCLPDFLQIVFEGAEHVRRHTKVASIGTTRAGFNTNLLANLDVPLPPLPEQQRIVAEVERRLSIMEKLEVALRTNLQRATLLRKNILQKAFNGRLVPQDPNDEPAAEMLKRIRTEQELATKQIQPKHMPRKQKLKTAKESHPVFMVLQEASQPLSPEELFIRCGRAANDIEQVEKFYAELRELAESQQLEELRPDHATVKLRIKR